MTTPRHSLVVMPCRDSAELAEARRRELDIPRNLAAALGHSAVEAAERGSYLNEAGENVDWSAQVQAACAGKQSIAPDVHLPGHELRDQQETYVQVVNETTLQAARHLSERGAKPLALNFANGIQPGGGFLLGARAQEEVLCRSSALYATLVGDPMYEHHRERPRPDSTDWVIYSPSVPVFRTDAGVALDRPWLLSFLTSAAPYAPSIGQPEAGDLLSERITRVLAVAASLGYSSLVLGAWGCGAFRNDPHRTARDFRRALETKFAGTFSEVIFAITDWSRERRFLGPFCSVFQMEVRDGESKG